MTERGTALLETLVFGFLVALLAAQGIVTIGRVAAAGEHVSAAARTAAVTAARTGDPSQAAAVAAELAPEAAVTSWQSGDEVYVEVVLDVAVFGPAGTALTMPVRGSATATISPYLSVP